MMKRTHDTQLVWDRQRGMFQWWCWTCNRSGVWHASMDPAVKDGAMHTANWVVPS